MIASSCVCVDCTGGQSEVPEATRAARLVPGARVYPRVCTQAMIASLCVSVDCTGGQSEVPEAPGAAWLVPGAWVYPCVCTQARAR